MESILEWYEVTSWQTNSSWASSKFWHLITKISLKLSQTVIQLSVGRGDMPHEICCIHFRWTPSLWECLISIKKDLTMKWCWSLHAVGQEAQGQKARCLLPHHHVPFAPTPCAFCPTTICFLPHLIAFGARSTGALFAPLGRCFLPPAWPFCPTSSENFICYYQIFYGNLISRKYKCHHIWSIKCLGI